MAKTKIGGITVEIGADTSDLSKKLKDVNSESKKTTAELKSIDAALKQAPNSVELWKQKQEALSKAVENSKKKLEALTSEQENLQRGLAEGTVTEEAYKAFQREIEITKGQIESAEKALKDFTDTQNKAGKAAEQTGKDLEDSGKKAENSSEGYTMLKNVVANLATEGFDKLMTAAKEAWEEIDEGYDTIITKTGATGQQLKDLQKVADNVFTSLPVEMTETGAAVGEINTRLEVTDDELQALTEHFLKYSTINNTEVTSSIRNVSGILKAFQEDTSKTGKVLDVLTDVAQKTGKDLGSLESELLSNSATFKELDLDIRQSAELLGQFEKNGIDTSTALAGLKKAQQNAVAEGKTMTEVLGETIENIKGAASETEALQIATDTFGKKGAAALAQAVREQRFSIDDLKAGYEDMNDVVNATFEATLDAPDKAKVALNNLKLQLAGLAEQVLPKVEKLVEKGVRDLPKIEKTVSDMLPLIKGIAAAYASWKIASTAIKGAEAISGLAKAMTAAEGATKLLNTTMLANPAVAVTAAIVGLTVAIGALVVAQKEETDISKKVTEQFKDEQDAADAARESINKMKSDFNERAKDIEGEAKRTEDLWKELDSLADASGRVKEADKKRAEYILGELNSALGKEYTITNNQIDGYKNLAAEIDNVIAKKKAEALLDQYMAMNSEMIKQNAAAQQNYENYRAQYMAAREGMTGAEQQFKSLADGDMTAEEYLRKYRESRAFGKATSEMWGTDEAAAAAQAYLDAKATVVETGNLMKNAEQAFNSTLDYIHKLDDAERAFSEERFDDVKDILYSEKNANKEILQDDKSSLAERQKAYNEYLQKINSDLKLYSGNWRQAEANKIMQEMGEVVNAGKLTGVKTSDLFTEEFYEAVQDMLDKGFDLTELTKWGKDSGIDVGKVFGSDYEKVVQKQIDKGFDVRHLLEWGLKSGTMTADEFYSYFRQNVQNGLNDFENNVDVAGMLKWAAKMGYDTANVFGENFSKYLSEWTRYLYQNNDLINEYSINSAADARYWRDYWAAHMNDANDPAIQYFRSIGWHASGGTITGAGIVAEAGPELLEIINGGVRVTPLTPSAMNTPIGAGKGTVNNYYYNTVNANVGSRYDVYKMAEDLETGERRIDAGKGKW